MAISADSNRFSKNPAQTKKPTRPNTSTLAPICIALRPNIHKPIPAITLIKITISILLAREPANNSSSTIRGTVLPTICAQSPCRNGSVTMPTRPGSERGIKPKFSSGKTRSSTNTTQIKATKIMIPFTSRLNECTCSAPDNFLSDIMESP